MSGTYCIGEGKRGASHIAHRLAMTPAGRSQAVCGAPILCVALDTAAPAMCNLWQASCEKCQRIAWAGHGNEERQAGAYA